MTSSQRKSNAIEHSANPDGAWWWAFLYFQALYSQMSDTHPLSETTDNTSNSSIDIDDVNSVDHIVAELKASNKASYGATANLANRAEFFSSGATGDIAIVKGTGRDVVEFLISGIFEIDRQNFFMGPEGSYFPGSTFTRNFASTKQTCQLIPVAKDPTYRISRDDFAAITANVKALERIIGGKKGIATMSSVRDSDGVTSIRLSHALFVVSNHSGICFITVLTLLPLAEKR